jgi:DNA-binding PadR family transcriptional regulator
MATDGRTWVVAGGELRALLHPFLLLLLLERSGHGYDLIERLGALGVPDVEPSHAYRVLRSLEHRRLVDSAWTPGGGGPARRRYELTPEGARALDAWAERLSVLDRVVGDCLARWARARPGPSRPVPAAPGRAAAPVRPRVGRP